MQTAAAFDENLGSLTCPRAIRSSDVVAIGCDNVKHVRRVTRCEAHVVQDSIGRERRSWSVERIYVLRHARKQAAKQNREMSAETVSGHYELLAGLKHASRSAAGKLNPLIQPQLNVERKIIGN